MLAPITILFALLSPPYLHSAEEVAETLMKRYHNLVRNCKNETGAAESSYKCSGIIIRGVNTTQNLTHAWSMKPLNKEKKSFSTSFLRADTGFTKFSRGYDSGFIIYPHFNTPPHKNRSRVLCAFPLDAWTDIRQGNGCGKSHQDKIGQSGFCDQQGINSFSEWSKHFSQIERLNPNDPRTTQCAFDLTNPVAAPGVFETFLQAIQVVRNLYSLKYAFDYNELRLESWDEIKAKSLPIEAFFYLSGSEAGRDRAVAYQKDFFLQSNETVPIVELTMPRKRQDFVVALNEQLGMN